MKYNEFREILKSYGYSTMKLSEHTIVYSPSGEHIVDISNDVRYDFEIINTKEMTDEIYTAVLLYAMTHLKNRFKERKYIVRHRYLAREEENVLNYSLKQHNWFLSDVNDTCNYRTEHTSMSLTNVNGFNLHDSDEWIIEGVE